ncbi:MAG: 2-oxo acid dehydrogenase subunit E2 [Anaerolineales bacterium]|nr:2-oxo acid dehydrogenase subunit E2 [Anaerolineales bacterium]
MATKVLMPLLGESVEEAVITRWLKAEGDSVAEFDPLVEVNTDKVDTEIPAPTSGTLLKILVPEEGTTVTVGTLLAWIGEAGEQIPTGAEPAAPPVSEAAGQPEVMVQAPESTITVSQDRELGFISPIVAKMAAQHGIDLNQVPGTGMKGRITKKDIENYLAGKPEQLQASPPAPQAAVPAAPAPASPPLAGELIPHSNIRRRIAEHMVASKRTSPHVTTVFEADLSRVVAHRQANKAAFERDGAKLTFTAYFVAATIAALKAYPLVNSSWQENGLLPHREINIGMATSLGEEGLIVPVIKGGEELSLLGLARRINDLAKRARAKQLQPDEVQGGTFTITNHGVSGSLFASPIINQPQCAILGVGKLQKRVVVLTDPHDNDTIAIRPMVYLTLTFDHRILDGAIADYFLSKVVESLENWS